MAEASNTMSEETLSQMLERLHELGRAKDTAAKELKDREKEFQEYQQKCFSRMEREGVSSQRSGEVMYVKRATKYAVVQDREEFTKWAEEQDETLIEPRERKKLLNALVRERVDNEEPLPPGIGFYEREFISRTAA